MIEIREVVKEFGDVRVLDGVNLDVAKSEVVALLGRSGSGKSTLLRCINALEGINGGSIVVDGEDVHARGTNLTRLRAQIGFVFQQFNLYAHKTARQNVTLAPRLLKRFDPSTIDDKAQALLDRVGLGDHADKYPHELSGGQQQRVAIARSLIMDPKVILFDEPTSALDVEMIREVLDVIADLANSGMTMIIVTHEIGFAKSVATQLAFMHEGRIEEIGAPAEVIDNPSSPHTRHFLERVLN